MAKSGALCFTNHYVDRLQVRLLSLVQIAPAGHGGHSCSPRLLVIAPVLPRLRFCIRCLNIYRRSLLPQLVFSSNMYPSLVGVESPVFARLCEQHPGIVTPELQRQERISKRRVDSSAGCCKRSDPITVLPGVAVAKTRTGVFLESNDNWKDPLYLMGHDKVGKSPHSDVGTSISQ